MRERRRHAKVALLAVVVAGCGARPAPPSEHKATSAEEAPSESEGDMPSYQQAIEDIATDIESAKKEFPQLAEFSAVKHCDGPRFVISYAFKTHQPQGRGGWAGAVPNPDPDGVWFHIDFHDPDSTAQIHTQPVVEPLSYREKRVMFLILEGEATKPIAGRLRSILLEHGVRAGAPD